MIMRSSSNRRMVELFPIFRRLATEIEKRLENQAVLRRSINQHLKAGIGLRRIRDLLRL